MARKSTSLLRVGKAGTVSRQLLTNFQMGTDPESRGIPTDVIVPEGAGRYTVNHYVGIGWIRVRDATDTDFDTYPVVGA